MRFMTMLACLAFGVGLATQVATGDGSRMKTVKCAESVTNEQAGLIKKMYKGSRLTVDDEVDNATRS
jgi:hypothetical protein